MPEWLQRLLEPLLGAGVLLAIIEGFVLRRRRRAEAGKVSADASKVQAETTDIIERVVSRHMEQVYERLGRVERENSDLHTENAELKRLISELKHENQTLKARVNRLANEQRKDKAEDSHGESL